jgi:hypothetical protein
MPRSTISRLMLRLHDHRRPLPLVALSFPGKTAMSSAHHNPSSGMTGSRCPTLLLANLSVRDRVQRQRILYARGVDRPAIDHQKWSGHLDDANLRRSLYSDARFIALRSSCNGHGTVLSKGMSASPQYASICTAVISGNWPAVRRQKS